MRTDSNRAGFYVMLGIIFFSVFFLITANRFKSYDRVVAVKGLCEKEVTADKVIWPIVFKTVGNDISYVNSLANRNTEIIVSMLKEKGLNEDEFSINSPKIFDRDAEMYPPENMKYRYNLTSVITVSSSRVDVVRSIMSAQGELINKGIALATNDYNYLTQFLFEGLNEIKPKMIEEATKNAREVALKFASDSDSKLGKIKQASQGQFSIEDRDANTPYLKRVRVVSSVVYYLKD